MVGSTAHRGARSRAADRATRISQAFEVGAFALGVALEAWAAKRFEREDDAHRPRQAPGRPPRATSPAPKASAADRSPARISIREWKAIFVCTAQEFQQDEITSVAGGMAYAAIVAIFPAMAAFVSIYGLFANPGEVRHQLSLLNGIMPGGALELVKSQLERIAATNHSGLSLAFAVGLMVSLWSATAGMRATVRGLNIAYETDETRGVVRLTLLCLALTLGGIGVLVLAATAVIVAPIVLGALHLSGLTGGLTALRWPLLFVIVVLALAVLYRFGPNRVEPRWRWVTPGSLAASALWLLGSAAFSWYIANFGHYDAAYGSLGALFGFLTWIWLSAVIVLFGAELNCEVERRTPQKVSAGRSPHTRSRR